MFTVFQSRPNGRRTLRLATLLAIASVALLLAPEARAEDDLLASMYTPGGLELRRDDRLITLFAAFNAAGFERAEQSRELPFPKRLFHPLRIDLRQSLPRPDSPVVRKIDRFLDAHPHPVEAYVKAALALGDAPDFAQGPGFPAEFDGLGPLLAEFRKAAGLERLEQKLTAAYRDEMRTLRDQVDGPFLALRAAYRLNEEEAPVLTLVPNPLDAASAAVALRVDEDFHVVVLGSPLPNTKADLKPALAAYSELLAREAAVKLPLDAVRTAIAPLPKEVLNGKTAEEVVAGSLHRAIAASLWASDASREVRNARRDGYFLAGAFLQALKEAGEAGAEPVGADEGSDSDGAAVASLQSGMSSVLSDAQLRRLSAEFVREQSKP